MKENTIIQGNALEVLKTLPDESVQCCVTSPPYWGLRTYGIPPQVWGGDPECEHEWVTERVKFHCDRVGHRGKNLHSTDSAEGQRCLKCDAWKGDFGLEPTVEMYIDHLVEVFEEVRRVLRPDGTLWLNMGDKYNTGTNGQPNGIGRKYGKTKDKPGHERPCRTATAIKRKATDELKRKDLIGLPWMAVFALRSAGWWFRRDIVWYKPNTMPDSAPDRPSGSHEFIMLLSKSAKYFYDKEAIKEPAAGTAHSRGSGVNPKALKVPSGWDTGPGGHNGKIGRYPQPKQNEPFSAAVAGLVEYRNKRDVWTIPSKPFPEAHFATFPPDLPKPCIQAGTSARGACPECGAPWERVIRKGFTKHVGITKTKYGIGSNANRLAMLRQSARGQGCEYVDDSETIGFRPTCGHYDANYREEFPQAKKDRKRYQRDSSGNWWKRVRRRPGKGTWRTVPQIVIDPFMGAGTVALVCEELGRKWLGIELSEESIEIANRRLAPHREQQKLALEAR